MSTPDTTREPCPDRILDDLGGAFVMGTIGGSVYHYIKGAMNSPKGERMIGGTTNARMFAPRTGGGFAVWGGMFSAFDCATVYLRQKEDPWNSIIAGAATGGLLQVRKGVGASSRSALVGGCMVGLIEGAMIMANRLASPKAEMVHEGPSMGGMNDDNGGAEEVKQGGFLSGWFDKIKEKSGSSSEAKVLESFDKPTPMPDFDYKL